MPKRSGALRTYLAPERPAQHHVKVWQLYAAYIAALLLIWWICGLAVATVVGIFSAALIVVVVDARARMRE